MFSTQKVLFCFVNKAEMPIPVAAWSKA